MPIKHGKVSQIIKAPLKEVFNFVIDLENAGKWSKTYKGIRLIEQDENHYQAEMEQRFLGKKFKATIIGQVTPYKKTVEEIRIDDGSIFEDVIEFSEIPEGTRIDWSGRIIKLGKWTKFFGPLGKFFFDKSVRKEFKSLAKYIESGEYKKDS